jgi:hypothetical protein
VQGKPHPFIINNLRAERLLETTVFGEPLHFSPNSALIRLVKQKNTGFALAEFVACYNPKNRHKRKPTWDAEKGPEGRWRKYTHEELVTRDKTSLDVFWLKDKSLTDLENLPEPDQLAEEIIENLEAGLNSFRAVLTSLNKVV